MSAAVVVRVTQFPFPWKFDASRYPEIYLASQVSEAQVQRDILDLLHFYGVDAVPIDAGGRRQRGRMIAAAKSAGVSLSGAGLSGGEIQPGFADLEATLAPLGRSLYIEVKAPAWRAGGSLIRPAGKPSPEQLVFLLEKHRRGAAVMVAWSSGDVEAHLGVQLRDNKVALKK